MVVHYSVVEVVASIIKSDLYQLKVGDVVEIDCKECSGLDVEKIFLEDPTGHVVDVVVVPCPHCTDGQQSYKITGPIVLRRVSDFLDDLLRLDQEYYTTLENKKWLCVSQAERMDR